MHRTRQVQLYMYMCRRFFTPLSPSLLIWYQYRNPAKAILNRFPSSALSMYAEPEFVNVLRSLGIDSQPGGPVGQPYLTYQPARLHRLAESIPSLIKLLQIRALVFTPPSFAEVNKRAPINFYLTSTYRTVFFCMWKVCKIYDLLVCCWPASWGDVWRCSAHACQGSDAWAGSASASGCSAPK
jgi:hypothetical protein